MLFQNDYYITEYKVLKYEKVEEPKHNTVFTLKLKEVATFHLLLEATFDHFPEYFRFVAVVLINVSQFTS